MLRRNSKFVYLLIGILFMFVSVTEISAATIETGPRLYFNTTVGDNYGLYYGETGGVDSKRNSLYKTIDGVEAICVQSDTYSPKTGDQYEEVTWGQTVGGRVWNATDAFVSGILMELVNSNYSSYDAYCFKYVILNSYLGMNKSQNYSIYNPRISQYIADAVNSYYAYAPTTPLPSFGAKAVKTVMDVHKSSNGTTYYVGSFKLSHLVSTFGTVPVTYKINLPSNVKLYTDQSLTQEADVTYNGNLSGDKVFYIKYTGSDVGSQVQITLEAYNSGNYSVARLWKPVDNTSNAQLVVTYDNREYGRYTTRTITFEVPDVNQKTIKIVKKDEGTGKNLVGSTLKLQLNGGSSESCTVSNGNYSCSIPINENLVEDTYYSVIETVAPDGYVLGPSIENVKWDVNAVGDFCYASTDNGLVATDSADCNRTYQVNTVCTTDDGVIKEGACEVVVDPNLPEDTPEDEKEYITVGVEEKVCHYLEGENVVKIDEGKCNTQYVKVTNSSGNLVVEYFNKKNHVEISKYAINGDSELVGAELKICSDKPNANGECTVVRNTLEGRCMSNATVDGQVNLTNEYNCVNNSDNTKTVDMHWISGLSSKIWYGIPKGTYYLVETVSPNGYLPLSTYVEFTVDDNGKVTSSEYNEELGKIIVKNKPTNFKVVKQDAKDGKKLAGATLSICSAFKDVDGNYHLDVGSDGYCFPAILSNGDVAKWETTDKAKTISGLGVGAYYLVELIAPENYSIADSIFFMVNEDGTITDKDGNLITDNKLVMNDVSLTNQKTGHIPILIISLMGLGAVVICAFSYYFLIKKNGLEIIKNIFNKKGNDN